MEELSLLILGAGWTATFLIPLLQARNISFAATTTTGHTVAGVPTLRFRFDPSAPESETRSAVAALPRAPHILITFPLVGHGQSKLLVETYQATHRTVVACASDKQSDDGYFRFIQLGSTGIWQQKDEPQSSTSPSPSPDSWLTRHSPYRTADPRAVAEDELLGLGGCVLDLAGLWGGGRSARRFVRRASPTKEAVRRRASLHLVHGLDVARALVALVAGGGDGGDRWEVAGRGQRWMVTDGFVYDWWALLAGWAEEVEEQDGHGDISTGHEAAGEQRQRDTEPTEQARWVWELMAEEGVRGLPREPGRLGRCYDSREFWQTLGLVPLKGRVNA